MDVYFCDLCGSRVNAADLQSGKGMRRDEDVICVQCVELGKGKRWLETSRTTTQVVVAVGSTVKAAESLIDQARDRAMTQGREDTDAPVQPAPIRPLGGALASAPGSDSDAYAATTKLTPVIPDFAQAAGSFMALGGDGDQHAERARQEAIEAADDLADQEDGLPIAGRKGAPVPSADPSDSSSVSPAADSASGVQGRRRSTRTNQGRVRTTTTTVAVGASQHNHKAMRILTIATVVMLVASAVLLFLAYGPKFGKAPAPAPVQENVSQTLRDMMADAKSAAKAALSHEPANSAELKHARDQIFAAKAKVDQFVEAAKQGPKPYTDAQLAQVMEDIGLKSTMSLLRSLNEKIADLPE